MKSLEELYKEVQENEELKKEFVSAVKEGRTEEFLKAHDCEATAADMMAFLNNVKEEAATEDDLAKVAGGCDTSATCVTCDWGGECWPSIGAENGKSGVC